MWRVRQQAQCTAVDEGREVTFNPNSPGTPTPAGLGIFGLSAVACPSTSQCTAVGEGQQVTFNPASPGTPTPTTIDGTNFVTALACPSVTQCTAVDESGHEVTFTPASPGTPTPATIDGTGRLIGVACPSMSQCTAIDASQATAVTFNPAAPGTPTPVQIGLPGNESAVSCPSTSLCIVIDRLGNAHEGDPGNASSWTVEPIAGASALGGVACASEAQCVIVDSLSNVFVGTPGVPTAPTNTEQPAISGTAAVEQTLSCSTGSWTGFPNPSFTYLWLRDGSAITGATTNSYVVQTADQGHTLSCEVTASNEAGKQAAISSGVSIPEGSSSGGGGTGTTATTASTSSMHTTTPPELTPPPILAQRQTASLSVGSVTIRPKGTSTFVPLSGSTSISDGSEVDATNGRVVITAATPTGKTVSAEVYGGRFRVHQTSSGETVFILTLPLTGCPRTALPRGAAARLAKHSSGPKSRHLWVSEKEGSWGTDGRYVSTSVEGTAWLTLDECTRSEVKVTAGKVKVLDLVRRKTKTVSTGHSYVAAAKSSRRHHA